MEYVSRITFEINGREITDFEQAEEKDGELYKSVELMNTTGFAEKLERPGVKLTYVVPKDGPEEDFRSVRNGRITIDRNNGTRITYTGCYPLKIGAIPYGKDEAKYDIEFGAVKRIKE